MKTGRQLGRSHQRRVHTRAGFTLLDVLVSIAVIAVLISILMPKLKHVHEAGRRVVCQSNARQIGIGLMTYANDYKGFLPQSVFLASATSGPRSTSRPQNMDTLRLAEGGWDGLGILYNSGYTSATKVFYCPSHSGEKPFTRYASLFGDARGEILGNYHYRGEGPTGRAANAPRTRNLDFIDPSQSSLLADGMQLRSDYNHKGGANYFRADLSVHWFSDPGSTVPSDMPTTKEMAEVNPTYVPAIWQRLDQSANHE